MSAVFSHPWLSGLFGDPEAQAIWAPERDLSRMIAFEAAWSRAMGRTGAVDTGTAAAAAAAIEGWTPDMDLLRAGTATDGLPVPALIRALKDAAGTAAGAVHAGATSQDVMDSAAAMALRDTIDLVDRRLTLLEDALTQLASRFGPGRIMGRTRMQDALPIEAAQRIAAWAAPLPRHRDRLGALRERAAMVQIGGPVGDRRGLHPGMVDAVADALGLSPGPCWHSSRDTIAEAGAVLAHIAGSCGKIGLDMALMAQDGTLSLKGGGGSSAMPHKQNPIRAELLVTLARHAGHASGALNDALLHEQERSGAAWALEWMVLPGLAVGAAKAVATATDLCAEIEAMGMGEGALGHGAPAP